MLEGPHIYVHLSWVDAKKVQAVLGQSMDRPNGATGRTEPAEAAVNRKSTEIDGVLYPE